MTCTSRRAPSRHELDSIRSHGTKSDSIQSRRRRGAPRSPAARRGRHPSDLPPRARGDQARHLAGGGLRRGGQGAARRSGGRRRGHSRSQAGAARARRFQEARSAKTREKLYAKICASAEVAVAFAPPSRIDRDNILRASLWALARAVAALPVRPQAGLRRRPRPHRADCDCQAVISGDAIIASIAAASIVAKVTRDRLMTRLGLALSRLRLRAPQGLQRARAFRRAGAARPDHSSPPLLRPGGRLLWRSCRGRRRARRAAALDFLALRMF